MNEKLAQQVDALIKDELAPDESVLFAIRGDLMTEAKFSLNPHAAGGAMLAGRRKLREAFAENGMPLSYGFALALTAKRMLLLETGLRERPKRQLGDVGLSEVTGIQLGAAPSAVIRVRDAAISLSTGATLPVRLKIKDDPEGFVQAFAEVARAS